MLSIGIVSAFLAVGCDRAGHEDGWSGGDEGRVANSSAGDARVNAAGMLEFEVTSDLYRRWVLAQQALGNSAVARSVAQLGRRALTQREVEGAIARVQQDAAAATATRNAGLSPAEYVFATISLEQAMAVAKGNFKSRNDAVAAAAAARNAEVARRYEEDLLRAGTSGDSVMMPPAGQYEPFPPATPLPPASPLPQPTPQPTPTPTPTPTPEPVPQPLPVPPPRPVPAPTDPQPQPQPQPQPRPTDPQPRPTEPQPRPAEPQPPPTEPQPGDRQPNRWS